jgi:T-complex protein 1 subunit zeta
MLVDGSGQVKLTKDGNVLLHEMQVRARRPRAVVATRLRSAPQHRQ